MRKIFFYCFLFLSATAIAQDSKFYVGLNTAAIWNSYLLSQKKDVFLTDDRLNWSAGVQSKYVLSKRFQLDAQLNFATKNFGSGIDYNEIDVMHPFDPVLGANQSHWNVRQQYLEIPISLTYLFSTEKTVNFFCSLGFTNSFFLSAKYVGRNSPFGVGERYKSYLISVRPGVGMLFPIGKGYFGSAECFSSIYLENVYHNEIKGNPFQLAVGFSMLKKFGLKNSAN